MDKREGRLPQDRVDQILPVVVDVFDDEGADDDDDGAERVAQDVQEDPLHVQLLARLCNSTEVKVMGRSQRSGSRDKVKSDRNVTS